jgi:LysM repeat protein
VRYSTSSASLTPATTPVVDDLGTYNAVGLATQYTVEVNTDTTAAYNYTNTYRYDYVGFGGSYREARQQASITLPGYTSGTTTTTFDSHGNAIQIDNPNGEPKSQRFIVDAQGRILHKDVTKKDNSVVHQDYAYVNGNPIGSNGDAESVYYDYNYTPISDQYPASNPGQYIVQSSGETLQGIAQSVFGDANLWYLIADANGLSAGATLVAGQALTIPNQVSNLHNDANTFRPYQPNEIIGDTTAAVKAPPPPSHKSNIFATILIAVVVVVVSYFAGPVLGQLVAEGLTALGASAGAAGAIGVAAGTVLGAAAGSAAGQGAGIALGVQDRFSFSAVGRAALTAAVVGGPSSGGGEATTLAGVIGEAVVSNVATQGVNIALGQQDRFSFAAVAASALAAGIEVKIGENIPGYNKITAGGLRSSGFSSPAAILGATTKNFVEGVFVRGVQSLVEKGGRINYATIAADSFGNALGNAVVGALQPRVQANLLASINVSAVAPVGRGVQVADSGQIRTDVLYSDGSSADAVTLQSASTARANIDVVAPNATQVVQLEGITVTPPREQPGFFSRLASDVESGLAAFGKYAVGSTELVLSGVYNEAVRIVGGLASIPVAAFDSVDDAVALQQSIKNTIGYTPQTEGALAIESALQPVGQFLDKKAFTPLHNLSETYLGDGLTTLLSGTAQFVAESAGVASGINAVGKEIIGRTLINELRSGSLGGVEGAADGLDLGASISRIGPSVADKAADFEALGITQSPLSLPEGRQLINALEQAGFDRQAAIGRAQDLLTTGSTVPIATPIDQTDRLFKVVPQGARAPTGSPFYLSESQYRSLLADPANAPGRLGLPASQYANSYDIYVTRPADSGTVVFESTIAPTRQGSYLQPGGLRQTLVINPAQFTPPALIGTFHR